MVIETQSKNLEDERPTDRWSFALLVVASVLATLLAFQTVHLRREAAQMRADLARQESQAQRLELIQHFNTALQPFVGKPFPLDLDMASTTGATSARVGKDHLFVLFNPNVCGRCVRDELEILTTYGDRLESEGVAVTGIIGRATNDDMVYLVGLKSAHILSFPTSYVDAQTLSATFPLQTEEVYIDTPIYFWTDGDLRVKATFKPNGIAPETLEVWLEAMLS